MIITERSSGLGHQPTNYSNQKKERKRWVGAAPGKRAEGCRGFLFKEVLLDTHPHTEQGWPTSLPTQSDRQRSKTEGS